MPRIIIAALTALTVLVLAGPAAGRAFFITKTGNNPAVAVDSAGTAHVVWDSVAADSTSTTHYCRVLRNGSKCAAGTEKTFAPAGGDQDFGGPQVFLLGGKNVLVTTARCCTSVEGPDGNFHGTRLFRFLSADGGANFDGGTWIGTQVPDLGGAYASDRVFLSFGTAANGAALQSSSLDGFTGTENVVTPLLPITGGVGVSSKGNVVAFADSKQNVLAGKLVGDPNTATIAFKGLGKGTDVTVTSGPKGADIFFKTTAKNKERYIVLRSVGGKLSKVSAVSEPGFPIFGTAFQDGAGRIHAVWQGDLGLTYRESNTSGRNFKRMKRLSSKSGFFNLAVGANGKGIAAMVFDSNVEGGRVGGFTA